MSSSPTSATLDTAKPRHVANTVSRPHRNTLISCLNLLGALFDELFHLNLTALETSQAQAPLTILIPNVVVEELDALKNLHRETTLRRSAASRQRMSHSVGALARKANKWMLMALQTQKRTTCASPIAPGDRIAVPERSWALHVENKSHALAVQQQAGTDHALELSADQQIILLCRHLNRFSGSPACLCSSDANARLSAEAEAISTFDLDDLDLTEININSDNDDEERRGWHALARDLIDQWKAQMGLIGNGGGSGGHDDKFNDPMTDDPHPTASMAPSDQTRFDSAHAADTGLTTSTTMLTLSSPSRHRLPASANGPARPSPMSARRLAQRITPDDYPDDTDRTTGSSFWAPERQIR